MTHRSCIAALLISAIGVAACGDDAADTAAACDAFVAIDQEFSINENVEAGTMAVEAFVASAPDDIADLVEPFLVLLRQDPDAAFESEELRVAETAADDWALDRCADTTISVDAVNYAFNGVPAKVATGRVAFSMTNRTQTDETHEMLVLRKSDDVTGTPQDAVRAALEGRPVSVETTFGALEQFTLVGGSLVEPADGDAYDVVVVDLEPGEYILACLLPVSTTELIGPYFAGEEVDSSYHFQSGMFTELSVR